MKVLKIIGVLFAYTIIILTGIPKLEGTDNKKKYKAVYYSIIALGIVIYTLNVFDLVPDYMGALVDFYKKISTVKKYNLR
jgi:hypothetical protein